MQETDKHLNRQEVVVVHTHPHYFAVGKRYEMEEEPVRVEVQASFQFFGTADALEAQRKIIEFLEQL